MSKTGGWSTRELAKLAGTTLRTVRHYHRVGLLEEPERTANGYKQYQVRHLVRLLRIRRLVDLGVSLPAIAAMGDSVEGSERMFRALDAELADSIERQRRIRDELAAVLCDQRMAELPPGFERAAPGMSDADRALALVASRLFEPSVIEELQAPSTQPRDEASREFDALTEDADEDTRQRLADRLASGMRPQRLTHPRMWELAERSAAGKGPRDWLVILRAVAELYNPAQIDVLQRVNQLVEAQTPTEHGEQNQ